MSLFKEPWRWHIVEEYRFGDRYCPCDNFKPVPYSPFCGNCNHVSENHIGGTEQCCFPLGKNLINESMQK